jgi:hypothetical protein
VGLHALGQFADRVGLGESLSGAFGQSGERAPVHDRGKVLTQAMLMFAGGGKCCSDIEYLAGQERLFGDVASTSTLGRTVRQEMTPAVVGDLWEAMAEVRAGVWRRSSATTGTDPVVLDIDASLVEIHSENKELTAPTYKGGYGFHPMFCFADATGEALAGILRPGNAGANKVADHICVLDRALAQLPVEIRAGHHEGDDPAAVDRPVLVRADSAAGPSVAAACRARNVGFAFVARSNAKVGAAISRVIDDKARWRQAERQDGTERKGAQVAELTDVMDLSGWPAGTRLIVRREPLHPGAQKSLFPSYAYRYWGHYTDQAGDPVTLDVFMRAHAHVEDHIRRLKDSGLLRLPFTSFAANSAWLALVCFGADLVRWFQLLCCQGALAKAEPATLRWRLWHTPARIIRRSRQEIIRILDGWPATDDLLTAYRHIAQLA